MSLKLWIIFWLNFSFNIIKIKSETTRTGQRSEVPGYQAVSYQDPTEVTARHTSLLSFHHRKLCHHILRLYTPPSFSTCLFRQEFGHYFELIYYEKFIPEHISKVVPATVNQIAEFSCCCHVYVSIPSQLVNTLASLYPQCSFAYI